MDRVEIKQCIYGKIRKILRGSFLDALSFQFTISRNEHFATLICVVRFLSSLFQKALCWTVRRFNSPALHMHGSRPLALPLMSVDTDMTGLRADDLRITSRDQNS